MRLQSFKRQGADGSIYAAELSVPINATETHVFGRLVLADATSVTWWDMDYSTALHIARTMKSDGLIRGRAIEEADAGGFVRGAATPELIKQLVGDGMVMLSLSMLLLLPQSEAGIQLEAKAAASLDMAKAMNEAFGEELEKERLEGAKIPGPRTPHQLKCVRCGVEFTYDRPDAIDSTNSIAELVTCPNGHMALFGDGPFAPRQEIDP